MVHAGGQRKSREQRGVLPRDPRAASDRRNDPARPLARIPRRRCNAQLRRRAGALPNRRRAYPQPARRQTEAAQGARHAAATCRPRGSDGPTPRPTACHVRPLYRRPDRRCRMHIDRHVVVGGLSRRDRLGVYAGEIGTSAVVLNPCNEEEVRRGTGRGALIVGLGEFGNLGVNGVTETVCAGVLRFLLHTHDRSPGVTQPAPGTAPTEVGLASLLIGYNSTANISVEDAVSAIVRGVCLV